MITRQMMRVAAGVKSTYVHIRAFYGPQRHPRPHAFFFTSLMLENVMPSARSLV
jgi:hypothetical protein